MESLLIHTNIPTTNMAKICR